MLRDLFRILSNIYDGAFLAKIFNNWLSVKKGMGNGKWKREMGNGIMEMKILF